MKIGDKSMKRDDIVVRNELVKSWDEVQPRPNLH